LPKGDTGEHARVLLKKALADEAAVRALVDNAEVDDAIVGFHAQQAVEKSLKAALAARGVAYPWTHDIRHLMELLEASGSPLPDALAHARRLTPWAAEFRYGETIGDALDRPAALTTAEEVRQWAETQIGDSGGR
jgi:HEPN domain-containing protein